MHFLYPEFGPHQIKSNVSCVTQKTPQKDICDPPHGFIRNI